MFKTKDETVSAPAAAALDSPLGGSYVAVFDRRQAAPGTTGGRYTGVPGHGMPGRRADSYVARFEGAPSPARTRGSYVDTQY